MLIQQYSHAVMGSDSEPQRSSLVERGGESKNCEGDRVVNINGININVGGDELLKLITPGYRFSPLDKELVEFYLKNKVLDIPLCWNRIYDVDIYKYSPEYLTETYEPWEENEWYFFTPRDRKYRKGKRPNRAAGGCGYWKATGADKEIVRVVDGEETPIGARKSLVFYAGKPRKGVKTDWIMQEFRIDGLHENTRTRTEDNMRLDDWVLCRIYNKTKPRGSGRCDETGSKQRKRKRNEPAVPTAPGKKKRKADAVAGDDDGKAEQINAYDMPLMGTLDPYFPYPPPHPEYELFYNNNENTVEMVFPRYDFQAPQPPENEIYCPTAFPTLIAQPAETIPVKGFGDYNLMNGGICGSMDFYHLPPSTPEPSTPEQ
ncbi:hypothetical protein H6P81_017056 [Aristolochia fimbriata]|uniref:NAC domain-containing protein n=1 Tax=Aristolochia fimbriata TaxID=158543 RepID=A0AAV7DXB0_ARIFI|nr:hypothetical protein H6P81_017056 [Aristolochia fimbriata]